ncbi:phosphatase PAP2 family protein [uncultured Lutibacter sp.]|mgnify:CR=1 FL=1|uniref:phosphatase PAP2 family protein n=1 Tax=uncultured Lutibacter sp. TaxID=437739 RepID=UPI002618D0D6|nr:phosphatase PAP2 family protein [uncultured Lutibacter sp.]
MDFLNSLISYDKQLLLFLHAKGSITWDGFWLFITNPIHWIPLIFLFFYLGYKSFGLKKTIVISLITSLSGVISLLIVTIIKNNIQRLRPINDISINNSIRVLTEQNDFSFVSGHSTVSFTIIFILFWLLKKHYKYAYILFLFPILFAYSRIYLAVHFPIDILFGMLLGYLVALVFYKIIGVSVLKR